MGDENGFQMGMSMSMGIAFENGLGYECGYGLLKSVPDCVPDLLVKGDQNTVKPKNKCRHETLTV